MMEELQKAINAAAGAWMLTIPLTIWVGTWAIAHAIDRLTRAVEKLPERLNARHL